MDFDKELNSTQKKYLELSEKIVNECGLELYEVEYITGNSTLRVFIIDPNTNSAELDDCVKVDRAFSPYCEELEWIPENFVLEVSSPGVYRNLGTKEHFNKVIDELISCTITGSLDQEQKDKLSKKWQKAKKFRGYLKQVLDKNILLEIDGQEIEIPFLQIKKANLDPEI